MSECPKCKTLETYLQRTETAEATAEDLEQQLKDLKTGTLLRCETLYDEQKAEITHKLFAELSLMQLQDIETLYLK